MEAGNFKDWSLRVASKFIVTSCPSATSSRVGTGIRAAWLQVWNYRHNMAQLCGEQFHSVNLLNSQPRCLTITRHWFSPLAKDPAQRAFAMVWVRWMERVLLELAGEAQQATWRWVEYENCGPWFMRSKQTCMYNGKCNANITLTKIMIQ